MIMLLNSRAPYLKCEKDKHEVWSNIPELDQLEIDIWWSKLWCSWASYKHVFLLTDDDDNDDSRWSGVKAGAAQVNYHH